MRATRPTIRPARREDAEALLPLIVSAGEGLPWYFWEQSAEPGETAQAVGLRRIRGDTAGVSWRNAWVAEAGGRVAGCLIAQRLGAEPDKPPAGMPRIFVPLHQLESLAPLTGYVNVLATDPAMQGQGVGRQMMDFAEDRFRGPRGMSLIVADSNTRARALYQRLGYAETARRLMVKNGWQGTGEAWVLMVKP